MPHGFQFEPRSGGKEVAGGESASSPAGFSVGSPGAANVSMQCRLVNSLVDGARKATYWGLTVIQP
jgi:hypothetical protein